MRHIYHMNNDLVCVSRVTQEYKDTEIHAPVRRKLRRNLQHFTLSHVSACQTSALYNQRQNIQESARTVHLVSVAEQCVAAAQRWTGKVGVQRTSISRLCL